ncbi:sulfotransferase family protein [Gilvimarinus japonicus]|uniref:Sulfotransferase family protein n=1 Tax=Gilvimarinus japonicus TaxID=1796469 RepID=A0ABV7HSA1_9GAMM
MDVFVFGVGRSGTTMMYRLVQQAYLQKFGSDFKSTYEPFIWNRELFNDLYENVGSLFGKTASLSIDGIYHHLSLPLFCGASTGNQLQNNEFFDHFAAQKTPTKPHVAKLIRANGRMTLFRRLNPSAKFILMVRNPIDVLNSVKHKFSFFGDDFYPSDYPRFCRELGDKLIKQPSETTWATRSAEYVYQMNLAAVEFGIRDKNTMIVEYDKYKGEPPEIAKNLCDFLGLEFSEAIGRTATTSKGPVTSSVSLSQSEFEQALEYGRLHQQMCENFSLQSPFTTDRIRQRYEGHCTRPDMDTTYEGLVTNQLRRIILTQKKELEQLRGCKGA